MLQLVKTDADTVSDVLIHARYRADGTVFTIDRCPAELTPQAWRDLLRREASAYLRALAGGRDYFRLPRAVYESLLAGIALPVAAE